MSLPEPSAGLLIRYAYLWRSEHLQGREEAVKDRPCAIILAIDMRDASDDDGRPLVVVLPVTHTAPASDDLAVEIPLRVKQHLGLDDLRSWVVLNESNEFRWPGPDLRPAPDRDASSIAYGFLPPKLFHDIKSRFVALEKRNKSRRVPRTE